MHRLAIVSVAALAGCTTARPVTGTRACGTTWASPVAGLLAERCGTCHGGAAPAGGYAVASYPEAIGVRRGGEPAPVIARAGDPDSRLLAVLGDETHREVADLREVLTAWVVECRLAAAPAGIHEPGLLDPASPDFHGALLASRNYDFELCRKCHGEALDGGAARASCLGCHPQGPTGCATCHGATPRSGAHVLHTGGGALGKRYACAECHVVPAAWDDPGHVRTAEGLRDGAPAEVRFGAFAQTATAARRAAPSFSDGRCSDVYCHGDAFAGDPAARDRRPSWTAAPTGRCDACHGLPPSGHPSGACNRCHGRVADATGALADRTLHLDGVVSLGDDSGTCQACHPRLGGAHDSHTGARHGLAPGLTCAACHVTPETVRAPGHLSGSPEVFPPGAVSPVASAHGAKPAYDPATGRCADVHCHGGGARLGADQSAGIVRSPAWNGTGAAVCGACHGVPPKDGLHDATWRLRDCAACHPQTMDETGRLLPAAHVNGVVDAR